ncbi:ribosomal protein s10p s20e [Diplodia corticola]|uniref:Small ribosomal subunit protein uS10m n=1 Tax=Diplodia corticola TaxID=236234 RepID=A0A1J9QT47_9PEZI|nr:ribosomal protein s10p s20e [Diplodia corticola]OJD31577.1 ribosomal protein s10p s20e [Diplodia corticola]
MAAPAYVRSPFGALKRAKISPPTAVPCQRFYNNTLEGFRLSNIDVEDTAKKHGLRLPPTEQIADISTETKKALEDIRRPRNIEAIFKRPLRRPAQYGIPVCDLQLRTFSVRNLEFFADFALRAAYYLGLAAKGPIPLPRIVERWTVPRANFVFKKSQENYERITLRRLIQIQDGDPEAVKMWLAFLQKHQYYGVGMKANVFEFEKLDVGKAMDERAQKEQDLVDESWKGFGRRKDAPEQTEELLEMINAEPVRKAGTDMPMGRTSWEK